MHALILGCGYLGRRVADAWTAQGHSVAALTRSAARADALCAAGIEPVLGDVTDFGSLRALPAADVVLHAVGLDRAAGQSQRTVYVDGLENVARALRGRFGTFLHVSSSSVYGQTQGEWVDEASACAPTRENGRVCLDAEAVLWRELHDPRGGASHRCCLLRLTGIYGPGRLLQRIETLRAGLPIGGNPDSWLNLIHVEDAAAAVVACGERGRAGSTYLVSDDRPVRRREYYSLLARLAGAPEPADAPLDPASSEATDLNKRCSNRRLKEELLPRLRFPTIETGLPEAVSTAST